MRARHQSKRQRSRQPYFPGKEDRERVAKRLATAFEVPIEEIVRALPPGSVQIAEMVGVAL